MNCLAESVYVNNIAFCFEDPTRVSLYPLVTVPPSGSSWAPVETQAVYFFPRLIRQGPLRTAIRIRIQCDGSSGSR